MSAPAEESSVRCFGGYQKIYTHDSRELKCSMKFAVYLPPQCEDSKVPVIYWLSGLTCNEQNFIQKAGAQRLAAEYGYIIVCPDTSPRNCHIPGEDESWDFGTGAGFYVDATQKPWSEHYRMYSYVTSELPEVIEKHFPVNVERQSIMGHSMGGHGALICALKNPGKYRTVSAFAPICNPSSCPWGRDKALPRYLGGDPKTPHPNWAEYDATELVKKYNGPPLQILIDQGAADNFLKDGQLLPLNFVNASKDSLVSVIYKQQAGYDHSYFFIATFIEDHFKHHSKFLDS
nr:PREDICTED: S-formylglutathione hydrolase [Bemisia tabaci]XP_018900969.1 PREDICTED: S-formylglutathione hydrolase [Bemisia tabaci]